MCEWKAKYIKHIPYECHESASAYDDPHSHYCILHSTWEDKNLRIFTQKVEERINKPGKVDLVGCYFPRNFDPDYFQRDPSRAFHGKPMDFREATFSGMVNFGIVLGNVVIVKVDTLNMDFRWATFLKDVHFSMTKFESACFSRTIFLQKLFFKKVTFLQKTDFSGSTVSYADFEGSVFEKAAIFDHAEFIKNVFFRPIITSEGKKVQYVSFGPETFFQYTRFLGTVIFQDVNLSHCSFLHSNVDKVDFRYCKFVEVGGRINVLKDERDADIEVQKDSKNKKVREEQYEPVRRLYLELKKNFEDKKDWNRAGDFHFGEMECMRKMKGWVSLEGIYCLLSGYGERPLRAAVSLAIMIGFCALVYMHFENLAFLKSVCDSIKITTLQRIGHVDEYTSLPAKFLFMFESIMGPILIALLALALRRKVKR